MRWKRQDFCQNPRTAALCGGPGTDLQWSLNHLIKLKISATFLILHTNKTANRTINRK